MAIEIATFAPVSAGTVRWRDAAGAAHLTVIVKATFEIRPDASAKLVTPYPLFGDLHYEDNEGRSLRVASDFAPRKARADVFLTGAAYAPVGERVTHRQVRLAISTGEAPLFDKRLLVVGTRERTRAGTPTTPAPFALLPLRYELAPPYASS
jgi:hypothetical protein